MVTPTFRPAPSLRPEADRLARFIEQPDDFTDEHWEWAKEIALKVGACMPQQMADSAFYFYYMGSTWEEIADKLNIPIGMVLYTAIHFGWWNKKKLAGSVRAGEKIKRADSAAIDLISDAIVATASLYKIQLAEVIKNPENAKNCPMIPKNYKDFMVLLQMMQSLQTKEVESSKIGNSNPVVNVNIANMGHGNQATQVQATTVNLAELPASEDDEKDRIELLRLLAKVKE